MSYQDNLEKLIESKNGMILTKEVVEAGISREYLNILLKENKLERIAHGVYLTPDAFDDEMYRIQSKNQRIVFSHETALYLHDLTDRDPLEWSVTIPYGYNATHLRNDGIKVYTVKKTLHQTGVAELKTQFGRPIKAYNKERTICDIARNRNNMDIAILNEAIKKYLNSKDKNIPLLMRYAEKLDIQKGVKKLRGDTTMRNLRQLKDLIKNMAKEKDINSQILLRNYMLERLLERISLSEFKDKFILKGGMLVAALVGVDMRSTIDMDATIKSYPVTSDNIKIALDSILSVQIDDGVDMQLINIEEIRAEDEYAGLRVSLEALMDDARIPLKVDITTGDKITPKEVVYTFDLLLEDRSIEILAYNIETVIAEKFETLVTRGIANTRMRDFYDIYILSKVQGHNIDNDTLVKAIISTSEKRGSKDILLNGELSIREVFESDVLYRRWTGYQKKYSYADDISWDEIKEVVFEMWNGMDL